MSGSESSDWESESDSDDGDIFQYVEEQRRGRLRKALIVLKRRISLRRRLGPKGPNKEPPAFSWEERVSDMDDAEFKKRYRLSTEAFDELVVKIWDKLTARDTRRSKCSRGEWSGLSGQKCSARCHDVSTNCSYSSRLGAYPPIQCLFKQVYSNILLTDFDQSGKLVYNFRTGSKFKMVSRGALPFSFPTPQSNA